MFSVFNGYNSGGLLLYNYVICAFSGYFLYSLGSVLLLFLCYRVPYCYSPYVFAVFLVVVVFTMFLSLFFCRVFSGVDEFFSGFVPVGTPLYICFLVCLAESISYVIRPIVLILRPFINISLGCFGAASLCGLCFVSWLWFFVLFFLFFYEVFVAVVHWYIVTSILSFSEEH
uniref:ATP synthase F0 subunit 6 n=1 Tax=Mosgovoyia sp. SQ20 TaxID=2854040 RepID=UPI001F13C671|nr:ATP synthase F0 subunit 6 [Mosgovoyia sp. SQ20]UKS08002.1 ATP synthase F0 subunit 6 [Mosgovoyia sp. SQ20]